MEGGRDLRSAGPAPTLRGGVAIEGSVVLSLTARSRRRRDCRVRPATSATAPMASSAEGSLDAISAGMEIRFWV